jgi:hypothetical protein
MSGSEHAGRMGRMKKAHGAGSPGRSGPATGSIHALRVLSFTSDTAEFDSLLAAGSAVPPG